MAMSNMGMMAGMAAGQALVQRFIGSGGFRMAGNMAGNMTGKMAGNMAQEMRGGQSKNFFRDWQGNRNQAEPVRPQPLEPFALVSKLAGRRRYRAACLSADLAELLQQKLVQLDFVQEVCINVNTGSLLIVFRKDEQAEAEMDRLAVFLRDRIFKPGQSLVCTTEKNPSMEVHAGRLMQSIRGTMRGFSSWIERHTRVWRDMSSASSVFLLLRGLRKMLLNSQTPSGPQMFWWAVSLMRGWRTV